MKVEIKNKDIEEIRAVIRNTQYEGRVYVVGGFVRDLLLGRKNDDIDLLIDGNIQAGINFAKWFCGKKRIYDEKNNPLVYGLYGTAMIHYDGKKIECVAPRKEKYTDGSRNPLVEGCTLEEESVRRDFTINSMFINISTGELVDFSGKGLDDLKQGVIRSTGEPDLIFSQDPLRMLRAIRFSCKLGFPIEEKTLEGIKRNVFGISIISQERITEEFNKIMVSDRPSYGLELIRTTGLLPYILPEFVSMVGMEQNGYHFGTVWEHTLKVVDNIQPILEYRLAALFHDLGKTLTKTVGENGKIHFYGHEVKSCEMVKDILPRMKYPNKVTNAVKIGSLFHMRFNLDDTPQDKTIRKFLYYVGEDYFELVLALMEADNKGMKPEYLRLEELAVLRKRIYDMINNGDFDFNAKLPVDGNDIKQVLEINDSPIIKRIKEHLINCYFKKLKRMMDKDYCIRIIKEYYKQLENSKKDEKDNFIRRMDSKSL